MVGRLVVAPRAPTSEPQSEDAICALRAALVASTSMHLARIAWRAALVGSVLSATCACVHLGWDSDRDATATSDAPAADAATDSPGRAQPDTSMVDLLLHDEASSDAGGSGDVGRPDGPKPDTACPTKIYALTADQDDGEVDDIDLSTTGEGNRIYLGYWEPYGATWFFFRFLLDRPIPAGAELTDARLELWGLAPDGNWGQPDHGLLMQLEDAADAAVVRSGTDNPDNPEGRSLLPISVRWPDRGTLVWQVDGYNRTPNLAPLLNQLASSRGGLSSGSHVQFWVRGAFRYGNAEVATPDSTHVIEREARLSLTVCP